MKVLVTFEVDTDDAAIRPPAGEPVRDWARAVVEQWWEAQLRGEARIMLVPRLRSIVPIT